MDFINMMLVTLKQPSGFWVSILNSFKGGMGSYILAVIMIALIVRVLFSLVDILNKKVNMKNMDMQAKMKPELDSIKAKYGHDQRLMQQKTSEIYKKYQFSMMGSCLPMLLTMVLQFTVFLTLWNSLQSVSNYNIAEKYQNIKNVYANVIVLNEDAAVMTELESLAGQDYNLSVDVDFKTNKLTINLLVEGNPAPQIFEINYVSDWTNEEIYNLFDKYVIEVVEDEESGDEIVNPEYMDTGYNGIFKALAEETAEKYYVETQEGFLWITNIYKSESPTSPLFTKTEIEKYLSKYYTEEEKEAEEANKYEGKIFGYVVAGIDSKSLGSNGYYILTILAVVTSFLSIWLSNKLMKNKNQVANPQGQMQGKMMYFIMPVIMGIFTFMYTSLFAIYLIIGQIVMIALTPLTTMIVRKWLKSDAVKKKEKDVIEVDYRRKDM